MLIAISLAPAAPQRIHDLFVPRSKPTKTVFDFAGRVPEGWGVAVGVRALSAVTIVLIIGVEMT